MFTLRKHINNLSTKPNKKINEDITIKNGIVIIENGELKWKYENDSYYISLGKTWVDLQGGVPAYFTDENLDEDIFIECEV